MTNDAASTLIASRYSIRRVANLGNAKLGSLVLFRPPSTEKTEKPPRIAYGIVGDFTSDKHDPARGVAWLGAAYEFIGDEQARIVAVIETAWQVVPNLGSADWRSPQPGDFLCSERGDSGIVVSVQPGQWAFLSYKASTASVWRFDREGLVMPWRLTVGDPATGLLPEQVFEHELQI